MKRFVIAFVLFLLAGSFFAPRVLAQSNYQFNPLPSAEDIGKTVDEAAQAGTTNKEIYSINTQGIMMGGVVCMIAGCSNNPQSTFYYGKSAVAGIGSVVIAMYTNPPADIIQWARDTGESIGFIPKSVHAQGVGFSGLSPLLPIWKAFRNISYALLALVMLIIGFMVMFRRKIDPKTVVTVQNALPKIVFALLLITFSYAIAAFFIDVMYLIMAIVINLIISSNPSAFADVPVRSTIFGPENVNTYLTGGLGLVANRLFGGGWSSIDDLVKLLFYNYDQNQQPVWWFFQQTQVYTVLPWIAQNILIWLVVSIAILFGIVRIAFMLISAYIQIIVAVLIAPFQLMTEAIPGSSSFSSWVKNMFANLSVFPITASMLLIGTMLTQANVGRIWTPPLLGGTGGSTGSNGIGGLIGLGILLTIPNIANSIKEALKAKAPVEAGFGAILGPLGGGVGQTLQYGYYMSMGRSLFRGHDKEADDLRQTIKATKEGPAGRLNS